VQVYKIQTSPSAALIKVSTSPTIAGAQLPGFFTSISSNGTASPIIWALSHPTISSGNPIYLYAFNPQSLTGTSMQQIFKAHAGAWPHTGGNSNLVPVVANGEVFVASYAKLQIFGIKPGRKK
jgi:hypothetical protein